MIAWLSALSAGLFSFVTIVIRSSRRNGFVKLEACYAAHKLVGEVLTNMQITLAELGISMKGVDARLSRIESKLDRE